MGIESGTRTHWLPGSTGDAALAVAVGVFVVLTTVIEWTVPVGVQSVPASGWALIVVASAALAFRRRYPVPVAVIVLVANALYYPLINPDGALLITLIIALYTLAAEGQQVVAVVIGLLAVIGSAYGEFGSASSPLGDAGLFLLLSWLVAAVALGGVARSRRAYLHQAQQRARDAERLRIARDLHDALGHNLALINVQAGAALHGLDRDPAQAAHALASIKEASKGALQELRKTLGMLRQIDEQAPTAPAPSLARLTELTSRAQDAGLAVQVTSKGEAPWAGGHPAARRRRAAGPHPGGHLDHLRPRRVRLRRSPGRSQRIPGQGHRADGADSRGARGGSWRRVDRAVGHASAHRRDRRQAQEAPAGG